MRPCSSETCNINRDMLGSRRAVARREALELVYFSFHVLTVVRPTHVARPHAIAYCCKAYSLYPCCKSYCYKASSVPYASLLQGSLLQGIISALCLPVTVTRHHQCPMPPCYKAHCYKASLVPYASLLQGIISALCLPVIRLTAARPHQCPVARLTASRPPPSLLSLHGLCYYSLYTAL